MNVTGHYSGKVDYPTDSEGPFDGIVYGAPVAVSITYDPSQVPPSGAYAYETNLGTNGNFTFETGNLSLSAAMDSSQTMGWPIIQFNDGEFSGLAFVYNLAVNNPQPQGYLVAINGLDWEITDANTKQVVASGTINSQPDSADEEGEAETAAGAAS